MSSHSLFSPSSASRWMACAGSIAFNEGESSNVYADDGTATHHWAAECLKNACPAEVFLGNKITVNGAEYVMDEERAERVQFYLDDVNVRSMGCIRFIEYKLDLSEWLGEDQGGTADCAIFNPETGELTIEDLKDGVEKVYASEIVSHADTMTGSEEVRRVNPQLGLYAGAFCRDAELMGFQVKKTTVVICQPKLGSIDEFSISYEDLMEFMAEASKKAKAALIAYADQPNIDAYCNPGEKQCRWCQRVNCPPRERMIERTMRAEFEDIPVSGAPLPEGVERLERAFTVLPFIEDWCRAVRARVEEFVDAGTRVNGPDGQPLKFVEGKGGKRKWRDVAAAEAALVGQLGEKAYVPRTIITAPAAAKLLNKKKTEALWKDAFEPLISKTHGKRTLALGSDPREPWSGAADADDFEEIGAE